MQGEAAKGVALTAYIVVTFLEDQVSIERIIYFLPTLQASILD